MFLMNKANMLGGIVIGTGDLSELALGWCTYNGDHMSMYAVNTGSTQNTGKVSGKLCRGNLGRPGCCGCSYGYL